jgi:hypothetical protein
MVLLSPYFIAHLLKQTNLSKAYLCNLCNLWPTFQLFSNIEGIEH